MSVNINADTTNGLVLTSDTSGELKLQSAGADIATVDSSGITMAAGKTIPASALTGSLPALDASSLTGIPAPAALSTATSSTSQPSYSCRAWIRWNGNGTGSGAINGSAGVSSYSRASTGDYDIFWAVTLDDANYAVTCCSGEERIDRGLSTNGYQTSKVTLVYETTGGTRIDGTDLSIMMIR